ncbi:MAG: hypothetical protein IKZ82_13340 [Clostridia bacterium]|nr:hypothetical protein [Clostridia bacterium]
MFIFLACFLTVLIETVFLTLLGLRKKEQTPVIICVNIVSNIALNLLLAVLPIKFDNSWMSMLMPLIVLEATVIFSEYFVYRAAFGDLNRLFLKTVFANLFSLFLGGAIMSILALHGLY